MPRLPLPPAVLRRHGGTAAALAGVVAAATAVSGSSLAPAAEDVTSSVATQAAVATSADSERTAASLPRASRNAIRAQIQEMRPNSKLHGDDATASELGSGGVSKAKQLMPEDPREIALFLLPRFGWDESQFGCLDELWIGESNWKVTAENPTSGAYGIPQALPASKMASAGADWETNAVTQIEWGLGYIRDVYGDPCAANSFKLANNWY